MTRYQYLILDSRDEPVARAVSRDGPERSLWQLEIADGDMRQVLEHEYINLVSTSEQIPAVEGRIISRRGNLITVESVRALGESVRANLRMPARFDSFLYPVTGRWQGRAPILSNDLSCGGIAFYCARALAVGEIGEVVIPITAQPLLLRVKILRQRPTVNAVPLYAAQFFDMLHEEEVLVREAVFSLQLSRSAGRSSGKN